MRDFQRGGRHTDAALIVCGDKEKKKETEEEEKEEEDGEEEEEVIRCHAVVMAANGDYWGALFFGPMARRARPREERAREEDSQPQMSAMRAAAGHDERRVCAWVVVRRCEQLCVQLHLSPHFLPPADGQSGRAVRDQGRIRGHASLRR